MNAQERQGQRDLDYCLHDKSTNGGFRCLKEFPESSASYTIDKDPCYDHNWNRCKYNKLGS